MTGSTLTEEFRAQARAFPRNIAIRSNSGCLTYSQLERESNALAHTLRANGVELESAVGVLLDTSGDYVISVLAVLKAGGCYVPLRGADPAARRSAVLSGADVRVVLTDRTGLASVTGSGVVPVLVGDRSDAVTPPATQPPASAESLAYIMFTSGSTGVPKAVGVPHRAVVEFARGHVWRTDGHRRVLLHSPGAFDASTYELWVPLLNGGEIVVPGRPFEMPDPDVLARAIGEYGVTGVFITSAFFAALAEIRPDCLAGAREVWFGGEAASAPAIRRVLASCPDLKLINGYGPTETTTFATFHRILAEDPVPDSVPIGEAMPDMDAMVLDDHLAPVPDGVPGEIYLAGAGLARGYLGDPVSTAERFVANPAGPPGTRMYRTGDLARRGPAGLEFLGRADGMVKLRGFRIELGEIDNALTRCLDIAQAVTVLRTDPSGGKQLVAYVRPDRPHFGHAALRTQLARTLPDYMIPGQIVEVDALPLNANGKIDRTALAERVPEPQAATGPAPRTTLEREIAAVWAEVLGRAPTGMDDSFLAAGGDSIKAVMLAHRIHQRCQVNLSVRAILQADTLNGLHDRVAATSQPDRPAAPPPDPDPHAPPVLTAGQHGMLLLSQLRSGGNPNTIPFILDVPHHLDPELMRAALVDVVGRHEPLRTVYPIDSDGVFRPLIRPPDVAFRTLTLPATAIDEAIGRVVRTRFDLGRDLPLRAILLDVEGRRSVLLLLVHHIACDGASMAALFGDLDTAYHARHAGHEPDLRPPAVRFNDFARWEQAALADPSGLFVDQLAYWRRSLAGLPTELPLPADRRRPVRPSFSGGAITATWATRLHQALVTLALQEHCGLFAVLQAGLAALLTRLGAGTDIPIGTATARRPNIAWATLVGFFANTVVLRIDTSGNPTFRELVRRARDTVLDALEHQDVPFGAVVKAVNPPRRYGRHPLFQVGADMQDAAWSSVTFGRVHADVRIETTGTATFDLKFAFSASESTLRCLLEYSKEIFNESTAGSILEDLRICLTQAANHPDQVIDAIPWNEES